MTSRGTIVNLSLLIICQIVFSFNIEASTKEVTLEELRQFVSRNNLTLKAKTELEEAKQRKHSTALSLYFPKLSLKGAIGSNSEEESKEFSKAYGEISMNLFKGGKDKAEVSSAKIESEIASQEKSYYEFIIHRELELYFYTFLFLKEKQKHLESSISLNEKHKGLIKQKKAAGMASEGDLMEFQLRETKLQSELTDTKTELDETKLGLIRLLGPEIGLSLEPKGELPHFHLKYEIAQLLKDIPSKSHSVKLSNLNSNLAQNFATASRAHWFPSIDAVGKFGKINDDSKNSAPTNESQVELQLSWEIFSGLGGINESREGFHLAKKSEYEYQQQVLTAMTSLEISVKKLLAIQEKVHFESDNQAKAEKYYTIVTREYRNGIKNGADLRDAEEQLLEINLRKGQLKLDFIKNRIDIESSLGVELTSEVHK